MDLCGKSGFGFSAASDDVTPFEAMAEVMAPKLPIQNRSTISPRCKSSPIGPRRHDRRQTRWADYTPTCGAWHEAHSPWPEGTYAGISSMFLQTPPGHLETSDERAQLWPATPTPSGGGTGYGFGVMERSSETHHGLSGDTHAHATHAAHHLHPPTRVAHLAAAAAHAAAAAKVNVEKAEKVDKVKLGIEALNGLNDAAVHAHDVATAALDEVMTTKEVKTLSKEERVLPSKGSATHGSGKCRPCAWYWKPQGCQNDKDCGYCHLCPEGELKNRKKSKVAAMRMGALVPASKTHKTKSYSGARVLKLSPLL